ncbi:hypothetical protein NC652_024442 [Populus alba x Populus x berolinensis]|nr:hypothetical protein NC652_024442 [Populus alba x Populus x berolinensis]
MKVHTHDLLFHLHIYPFPAIYKRRKKICLSVNSELFLQYLLIPIQADPLLFQILNSKHLWMNVNPNHRCEILKNINSLMFARVEK